MRRLRQVLMTALLVAALVMASAGAAIADDDGGGSADWYGTEYDDGAFDDEWYDDTYDDEFDDDTYDDEWYDDEFDDDTYDDEWYDDEFEDPWVDIDPEIADEAVASMVEAIDACFESPDAGLGWCILDAVDLFYGQFFPEDEFTDEYPDDGWYDDEFDEEFSGNDGDGFFDDGDDGLEPVDDPEAKAAILARFNELIPAEWRDRIVSFELESDGRDGAVAAVEPVSDDLTEWALYVDPADADFELDATLIHEFAHVMTLNETQIDAQIVSSDREYEQAAAVCDTYFTGEGCSLPGSYIAQFVDLFWDPIMDEFKSINDIQDEREWEEALFDFYDENSDQFVSDYAAANPAEDMSETFAAFVLAPDLPDGDTIAEQKILFFSQFDELMDLRDSIRRAL